MSKAARKSSRKLMANRFGKRRSKQAPALVEKVNEATAESAMMPNRAMRLRRDAMKRRAPVPKDLTSNKRKKHLRAMKEATRG